MKEVLGIDIGGVIIDRIANDNTDTSFFSDNYLATTAVLGAFEAIRRLTLERFGSANVYLISKASEKTQKKTRKWLEHSRFFDITAVKRDHLHFCLERREKLHICRALGITHMIDDKLEVHSHLAGIVDFRYLLAPDKREVARFMQFLPGVMQVQNWQEILEILLEAD